MEEPSVAEPEGNTESEESTEPEESTEQKESTDSRIENPTSLHRKYFYSRSRFKWSSEPAISKTGRRRKQNIVIRLPGLRPTLNLGNQASPLAIWQLLFTDEICAIIIRWTNVKIQKERAKYKRPDLGALKDLDMLELHAFLGLLGFTSLFKSNNESINTLFATNGTGREIIRCIMSKERFCFLLTCLRFDNPDDRVLRRVSDPAAPISELFDLFVKNCQTSYTPGTHLCIDEMLIGFRGRCKFKIYLPSKPVKYGLKIMCCTDARTGYFYNGYIYTGKDSDGTGLPQEDKRYNKPTQAVLRLTRPLYNTNRSVTFDNWFTSIELINALLQRGLTCIGTLKKNKREIPKEFLPNKEKDVGTTVYGFTRDITLLSYTTKRNKAVILASSQHHHRHNDPVSGKPQIIADYNSTKGGVDALDEKCAKFSSSRRTQRWPMAIFYQTFDISTVNAYIMYESFPNNQHLERGGFLEKLCFQLVTPHMQRRTENPNVPRKLRNRICEILGKMPVQDPQIKVEKLENRKTCSNCPYQLKRRTAYVCYSCQKPICLECAKKFCPDCAEDAS